MKVAVIKLDWYENPIRLDRPHGRTLLQVINECEILKITDRNLGIKGSGSIRNIDWDEENVFISIDNIQEIINHKNYNGFINNLKRFQREEKLKQLEI